MIRHWLYTCLVLVLSLPIGAQNSYPAQASQGPSAWSKFEDPLEKAYTVDVPQGWTAKGGLFRLGYSDERIMLDTKSPDGKISMRLGDVAIPTYFLPNANHREGDVYDLGAQAQGTVARYRTGQEYAVLYAQSRFKSQCQTLTQQPGEGVAPADGYLPPDNSKSTTGQARYSCASSGGARTVYVWARTTQFGGLWQVQIVSFLASPDQASAALAAIVRCERSFKLSPAWVEQQKKYDEEAIAYQRARQQARMRQLSQQVAQFEMRMQAMQNQVNGFLRGQARQAAQVEEWGNILTGITPTVDPLGNRHDVWTGPKSNYWINGRGDVVNSNTSPGPGWQQLQPTK